MTRIGEFIREGVLEPAPPEVERGPAEPIRRERETEPVEPRREPVPVREREKVPAGVVGGHALTMVPGASGWTLRNDWPTDFDAPLFQVIDRG